MPWIFSVRQSIFVCVPFSQESVFKQVTAVWKQRWWESLSPTASMWIGSRFPLHGYALMWLDLSDMLLVHKNRCSRLKIPQDCLSFYINVRTSQKCNCFTCYKVLVWSAPQEAYIKANNKLLKRKVQKECLDMTDISKLKNDMPFMESIQW